MKLAIPVVLVLALAACGPAPRTELDQVDAGAELDAGADAGHQPPVPVGTSCPDAGGANCACIAPHCPDAG